MERHDRLRLKGKRPIEKDLKLTLSHLGHFWPLFLLRQKESFNIYQGPAFSDAFKRQCHGSVKETVIKQNINRCHNRKWFFLLTLTHLFFSGGRIFEKKEKKNWHYFSLCKMFMKRNPSIALFPPGKLRKELLIKTNIITSRTLYRFLTTSR